MGGLGISSVPNLTITSPLVNRSCSSHWNYRRCQSPHKGCCLATASKLIIRENPGSHPSRLTQSPQQATPPFRCSLYSQFITYMIPSLLFPNFGSQLGSTTLNFFVPNPWVCHCLLVHANCCRLWPYSVSPSTSPSTEVHIPSVGWKHRGYGRPRDSNPGPPRWKLSALPLWAIQTTISERISIEIVPEKLRIFLGISVIIF